MHTQPELALKMRYEQIISKIDEINSRDPNQEYVEGKPVAKELIYSKRMADCLDVTYPDAPETLKIAVYAQHINRWKIPRSDYPTGRQGYLKWRRELADHHAQLTGELMQETGYSETETSQVAEIIKKRNLKHNELSQKLEDVACLVFLEYYLGAMTENHSEEKMIAIIQKTWRKMSESGQNSALKIDYTVAQWALIEKALQTPDCD